MTERSAINQLLKVINELPLAITDNVEDIPSAVLAKQELDFVKEEILADEWWFNSSKNFPFYPDTDGFISVNDTYLSIKIIGTPTIIIKDHKLYDNENFTFKFTDPVQAEVILNLDFDDIPYTFANWIVKKASVSLYSDIIGDVNTVKTLMTKENKAMIKAKQEDARANQYNALNTPHAQDFSRR